MCFKFSVFNWSQVKVHFFGRNSVCFLLMMKVVPLQKDVSENIPRELRFWSWLNLYIVVSLVERQLGQFILSFNGQCSETMTLVGVASGCYALLKGKLELLMLSMKDCWTKRNTLIVYLLWSYMAYYWRNYEKASSQYQIWGIYIRSNIYLWSWHYEDYSRPAIAWKRSLNSIPESEIVWWHGILSFKEI